MAARHPMRPVDLRRMLPAESCLCAVAAAAFETGGRACSRPNPRMAGTKESTPGAAGTAAADSETVGQAWPLPSNLTATTGMAARSSLWAKVEISSDEAGEAEAAFAVAKKRTGVAMAAKIAGLAVAGSEKHDRMFGRPGNCDG